jgi:carboxylesterase
MHGFTASPWEVRGLAECLEKKGMAVYAPLLAGHGTKPEDLKETSWREWYESANKSYSLMKEACDCVYVGGMSTGGMLSIMLAREHDACGIVSIGTPVFLQDWRARFAFIIKYFVPYTTRKVKQHEKQYYYEKRPTASVAEILDAVSYMKSILKEVDEPILAIQSLDDSTVKPESAEYIMDNIGSEKKILMMFDNGGHVIINSDVKEEVYGVVSDFIRENSQQAPR